jgi:predicted dehydrogenase
MSAVRLAVVGAGLIGRRHVAAIAEAPEAVLCAVVDPAPAARDWAEGQGARWFANLADLLAADRPDGVIVATPNALHVEHGLACVAAGLPALIEKPLATDAAAGLRLVEAAKAAGVPLLTGHHRRHNPLVAAAKARIDAGALGRIVAVHGQCWLRKPDDYFVTAWRREAGAGPVLINLIHDIDLMRHLCGEVAEVQAVTSSAVRGFAVEDTAVILLRFASGALGTLSVSDAVVAPWSWEMTARENPAYPATDRHCYLIGGTHGSLELPLATLWHQDEPRSWWRPLVRTTVEAPPADPLVRQITQFARVIGGAEAPLVSGREGLRTLAVVEAVVAAASKGRPVRPSL